MTPRQRKKRRKPKFRCQHLQGVKESFNGRHLACGCSRIYLYPCRHFGELVTLHAIRPPNKVDTAEDVRQGIGDLFPEYKGRACQGCKAFKASEPPAISNPSTFRRVAPTGLADKLTICLTHYGRPQSLAECLESLDRCYPDVPRIVQDTGGNISWGRNQAIAQAKTPYVMICEEDFVFTAETDLAALIGVLESDAEIGGACGTVKMLTNQDEAFWYWYSNLRRFRGQLHYEQPTDWRATPSGTAYVTCDLLSNGGVWRREVFDGCPWDENLEIQEHQEWFWRFKQQERYRCAYVPSVSIDHWHTNPTAEYKRMRSRREFRAIAEEKMSAKLGTLKGFPPDLQRPNIVVLGVGHSNTSITVKQLHAMGWRAEDADAEYGESVSVREVNERWAKSRQFDRRAAERAIQRFTRPWAIKDPRFARGCLHHWLPILAPHRPLLLWVTKNMDEVRASYLRRNESADRVDEWLAYCERQFRLWPWAKLRIDAEQVGAAVRLWQD